jgi:3-oxoacyl-[acyl-carrier-protein] synthase II
MTTSNVDVAVTGAALLTPLGDSVDAVCAALERSECAIETRDVDHGGIVADACIASFDAERYAKVRGMRVYNRATQLAICAATRALADAHIDPDQGDGEDLGLIMASTFGHLDTLIEYDRSLLSNGVARTNPVLMPLGLPSAPGAATALAFRAKAFSITLADGGASSLDALGLATRLLRGGRAKQCVVVSTSSPPRELAASAARAGLLTDVDGVRIFDRHSRGCALGEGAAAVVLEPADLARARGVGALGFVRAHAAAFACTRSDLAAALHRAGVAALRGAGVVARDVTLVSSSANGCPDDDASEARALGELFAADGAHPVVTAAKGNLGDTLDAGGLLQAVIALEAMRVGRAPPIARLREPAASNQLRYAREVLPIEGRNALVTATSRSGACATLVLSGAPRSSSQRASASTVRDV